MKAGEKGGEEGQNEGLESVKEFHYKKRAVLWAHLSKIGK